MVAMISMDGQGTLTAPNSLPLEVQPTGPLLESEVEVEASEGVKLSADDIREIEDTFGVACVSVKQIRALNNLGVFLKPFSIRMLTQSNMFLAQQHIIPLLKMLSESALSKDIKHAQKIATTVGYLAEKLAKVGQVTKTVGEIDGGARQPRNQSFSAGEQLVPVVNVQVNNNQSR